MGVRKRQIDDVRQYRPLNSLMRVAVEEGMRGGSMLKLFTIFLSRYTFSLDRDSNLDY